MRIENGQLILEKKNCTHCRLGSVPSRISCPKCNGTGNGPRGGKRGCRNCHGFGDSWDHDNRVVCDYCNGDYYESQLETPFDHIHFAKDDVEIKVVRDLEARELTLEESYFGVGLFSCTDYGRHKTKSDDELIEDAFHFEEKGTAWTQGIKLIKDKHNLAICNYLAIVTADQGYSVIPIFEEA